MYFASEMCQLLRKIVSFICNSYFIRLAFAEIMYQYTGFLAIMEDVLLKNKNKCGIVPKTGKVALVTGGARGMGYSLVKKLLECDMHVIIGCRNVEKGEEAVKKIRNCGVTSGNATVLRVDLSSISSINSFSAEVKRKFSKLNLLVNNAGIMFPPFVMTEDGFESQWFVNYLGPFLLTHNLMPLIQIASKQDQDARIVNVSSCAHTICKKMDLSNLNHPKGFISGVNYAVSKIAQILFTFHLSNLLQHSGISVHCVHPGIVNTEIFDGTSVKLLMPWVLKYVCKNADEGAVSILYACISQDIAKKSGLYLSNCQISSPSSLCNDKAEQSKLFSYSLKQLNLDGFDLP